MIFRAPGPRCGHAYITVLPTRNPEEPELFAVPMGARWNPGAAGRRLGRRIGAEARKDRNVCVQIGLSEFTAPWASSQAVPSRLVRIRPGMTMRSWRPDGAGPRMPQGEETGTGGNGDATKVERPSPPTQQPRCFGCADLLLRPVFLPTTGKNADPELSRFSHRHPALVAGMISSQDDSLLRWGDRSSQ
jgi:hypothetical protein